MASVVASSMLEVKILICSSVRPIICFNCFFFSCLNINNFCDASSFFCTYVSLLIVFIFLSSGTWRLPLWFSLFEIETSVFDEFASAYVFPTILIEAIPKKIMGAITQCFFSLYILNFFFTSKSLINLFFTTIPPKTFLLIYILKPIHT